ncbi:MAG: hypothetical protein ABRQ24_03755 [Syntrophomonadaceae bacterium]
MPGFIVRYYYCLKEDASPNESLANILTQNSFTAITDKTSPDFSNPAGFYFNLADISGKLAILAVKTPEVPGDWAGALKQLQELEKQSAMADEDLMGRLTLLVTGDSRADLLLEDALPMLPCREAVCPPGHAPLFRLPIDRKDTEAVYVYRTGEKAVTVPLLVRRLPNLHAQMIYLSELNTVLRDRNHAICLEKDDLSKELIRILHTRLVMNQPSTDVNQALESEIGDLATAFAKLVADKKLAGDGVKRLDLMLQGAEKQFLNEPAMQLEPEQVREIMSAYYNQMADLQELQEELKSVEENYRQAIAVVQGKIQVINSRTNLETQEQIRELLHVNLEMQKKSLVYQFAAGLIEFIILAYYSLSIWTNVSPVAAAVIPGWVKLVFVFLFSGTTVSATHYMSEYLQGETHVRRKLIMAGILLVIILSVILLGTWSANMTPGAPAALPAH